MKNKNTILVILIVILVLVIVAISTGFLPKFKKDKQYNMVYLSTGEVYIGKLSSLMSNRIIMTDSYILNTVKDMNDETKTNFQLSPLKDNIVSSEKLYINKDQIIFYGPIKADSKIGEALINQK
ncbi:MAG: hypothetical protein ABH951_00145 [Patescibacteria group bacterium]